ncbi:protein ANTAGONIST OF LIKE HETEROCHROMATIN PROTEIN 1 [Physcomitrium patens]|uniref:DDE Tnp4 domain-containing protein n=1 Tax=Physcomitrium patens TaxID=3218 RepID=A0A2K1JI83_PHYPA|nr:protein ANTAGONIST OF LIKE HETEROCHROMATIN PROTEIN 1-like [Physcomitrium patens]XP_024393874.1 protein ANTAGONIST OF LIKE HETEROCHROMATIN PROTEIN 1-like [Physcomitrium patens]XP_024393875.1 protein ANTAGONIST OF LIKE HETEROCHROMATIN PROTEIN 1-like [Physcomitrium patens]XP_024393876.1 protein ANTAGONIST OF LIKE HETEROCHROMATIN PROTEIN 1-like [Physcomitrium patens]XP_024393877.1 protein ANTAGONIST OF LIKE HETEROCHROMATIN PROTEIN 1-like [Physcomitrium patens]XP_024393878.1 protein ANTAGONIST O|eukprot:XP_024393873.1 protein ANTAGONIST OF LIKE HETEROCHROMATIN PROTEIN 1-like [Physcomitrella patens]
MRAPDADGHFIRNRSRNRNRKWQLLLLLLLDEEEERQQQWEDRQQALAHLQWQHQHARRQKWLQNYYSQLQALYADLDVLESYRLRRAHVAAAALGAAVSTQQSVHRRLWVKNRSQAWWAKCNHPDFPDEEFHRSFRMSRATFNIICDQLAGAVAKENTMLRAAIPVEQRVAVCIWRLATGEPLRLVSKRFGLGISTCHKMVLEVCAAINDVLLPKYVQWSSAERLQQVTQEFEAMSGMRDVVGALYTTHVPIIAPKINVAAYFNKRHTEHNQKTSYSITLQGMVDVRGSFTDVSIGWPGSMSDERVFEKSTLYRRGLSEDLRGMWVVGGPGYPLLDWLLVPYVQHNLTWAQHAFNEKVAELLQVARSAFSRLKGRWKFLQRRTEVKLQELPAVLGACCVLHNICEMHNEGFDPELHFEVVDDEMLPENINFPITAMQARDAIAHNLLHNVHAGSFL